MIKLLSAGLSRLKSNKAFYSTFCATLIALILLVLLECKYKYIDKEELSIYIDTIFFISTIIIGIISSIFTPLFIGADYSDGTMRNKIIVGHKRSDIYLSNLIISVGVSLLEMIIYMFIVGVLGILLLDGFSWPLEKIILLIFDSLLIVIVFSSIFTLISMLCSNTNISGTGCLILMLIMYLTSFIIFTKLDEPYIDTKIKFYQFLVNLIPTGQAMTIAQMMNYEPNYKIFPLYSISLIILTTIIGLSLFKRKELN